jgi:hypothetical protein
VWIIYGTQENINIREHRKEVFFETGAQQRENCIFVSIGDLPLLYFVFFYKEDFDDLVEGDEKEYDNENM